MGFVDKVGGFVRSNSLNKKEVSQTILAMIKVLTEGTQGTLRELLFMCAPYFRDGELSVLKSDSRTIIATTHEAVYYSRVENVALYVKDVKKKEYYLKEEDNGMFFSKGVGCIRIVPLKTMGGAECFLMVEQDKNGDMSTERMLDMISIATRIHLQEMNSLNAMKVDRFTGLGNRDAFVDFIKEVDISRECYIGFFAVRNMHGIVEREGMTKVECLVGKLAAVLEDKCKDNVFRVRDGGFCVVRYGPLYSVISLFQDCVDRLVSGEEPASISCVALRWMDEPYRLLYLLEKASDENSSDAVVYIREKEAYFDVGEEEKLLFLDMRHSEDSDTAGKYVYQEFTSSECVTDAEVDDMQKGTESDFDEAILNWSEFGGI